MQANISGSFFRPEIVKRIVIYGLLTVILGSAQCSFFPILKICPMTPDVIMGMLLGIALIDSPKSAAICALFAGAFIDAVGTSALSLSPVMYLLFVVFIGLFSHKMLSGFASFAILLVPTVFFRAIASTIISSFARGGVMPASELFAIIVPEAICTVICCLPLYFVLKACSIPLETHSKFTF